MPTTETLEVQFREMIVSRPDSEIIAGRWKTLADRRKDLRNRLVRKGVSTFSFDEVADICVSTRAVWIAVHALVQAFRKGITEALVRDLTQEFDAALESTRKLTPDTLTGDAPGDSKSKAEVVELVRLSIQARMDSFEMLLDSCSLDEFEKVGILRHEGGKTKR